MIYYRREKQREAAFIIRVQITGDFDAYIRSCPKEGPRYAYRRKDAKPFPTDLATSQYVEKKKLRTRFPLGCTVVAYDPAEKKTA